MVLGSRAHKIHQRAKVKVPVHFFPDKVKRIHARPHVGAASDDAVFRGGGVVAGRAWFGCCAYIRMRLEDSEGRCWWLRRSRRNQSERENEESRCRNDPAQQNSGFHRREPGW